MRAFVITGPGRAEVREVPAPEARPGQVVVDVERAGVCGTDMEFFRGEMSYLHNGQARYPVRIGHEWSGTVGAVGAGVDGSWLGRRVTGDTMLGCGHCGRCRSGRQHVCADRYEIGIRNGWPGALAEQLPVPVTALQELPAQVDAALGALVEPAGNGLRAVRGAALPPGGRLLVLGPGTIGLLTAQIAAAQGAEVHLLGRDDRTLEFAASVGLPRAWTLATLPDLTWTPSSTRRPARSCPRSPCSWWNRAGGWSTSGSPPRRAWSTPGRWRSRTSPRWGCSALPVAWPGRSSCSPRARSTRGR